MLSLKNWVFVGEHKSCLGKDVLFTRSPGVAVVLLSVGVCNELLVVAVGAVLTYSRVSPNAYKSELFCSENVRSATEHASRT